LELDVYVLVLGSLAALTILSWLRQIAPKGPRSELDAALAPHAGESTPIAELARLEREVVIGSALAFDLHYRLRPIAREIAARRLERRGLELDSGIPAVQAALAPELWELVRPDREAPADRQARGPGIDYVRARIEELEAV